MNIRLNKANQVRTLQDNEFQKLRYQTFDLIVNNPDYTFNYVNRNRDFRCKFF